MATCMRCCHSCCCHMQQQLAFSRLALSPCPPSPPLTPPHRWSRWLSTCRTWRSGPGRGLPASGLSAALHLCVKASQGCLAWRCHCQGVAVPERTPHPRGASNKPAASFRPGPHRHIFILAQPPERHLDSGDLQWCKMGENGLPSSDFGSKTEGFFAEFAVFGSSQVQLSGDSWWGGVSSQVFPASEPPGSYS